ncbi:MAG: hypothetical protein DRN11_00745 [Thermoplasmata archaeon]|nr:MAG: hypothetical protein DRN11_00745 [Thermoplasmata archaeon]
MTAYKIVLTLLLTIFFPFIFLLLLSILFIIYKETFEKIGFGKRELSLLIVGSLSTKFFDLPIFVYKSYLLALNVGGALIPLVLSFYLICKNNMRFLKILLAVSLVAFATYMVTIVKEEGVISYFPYYFLPIILSFLLALLFCYRNPSATAFAYICSTLGVIIGGDFSHLPELFRKPFMGSMGGAGIYDLVYLSGLISFCITFPFVKKEKLSKWERLRRKFEKELRIASKLTEGRIPVDFLKENYITKKEFNTIIRKLYENAPFANLFARILAFLIDFAILSVLSFVLLILFFQGFDIIAFIYILLSLQIFYFMFLEYFFGASIGKAIAEIKVKTVDNDKLDFMGAFTRNILRPLEFFLGFYLVSLLFILLTPKKQRFGDIIADTIVVREKWS